MTHFIDAEAECERVELAPPVPPLDLCPPFRAKECLFMRAPAGWASELHPSSARILYFVLAGEWEIVAADGEVRRFRPGAVLLAEDTFGKGHASRVLGDIESIVAVVRLD